MANRLFTPDEVNALIPTLTLLIARMQQRGAELRRAVSEAMRARGGGEEPITVAELLRLQPQVEPAAEEMESMLRQLEASGGQFKGLDLGLVDFPAEIDGESVLLCWQYGEREVGFYHSVDGGFAGRKALPRTRSQLLQ